MAEPAFVGAGKVAGLELWRIENLKPVKVAKVTGKFYSGDSYILLSTTANKSGSLSWAIHFWFGKETTNDESGVAAYKSVELDDSLGGRPVQYREVQGYESSLFLSYFKNSGGVVYLDGGVASGFKHVDRDSYETRLLHVKGKRDVRVSNVPVTLSSLNRGDVFVLDKGLKIFVFNGPTANKYEKSKGLEVARNIKDDERGGKAEIVVLDDNIRNSEFWGHFGGFKDPNTLPEGASDDTVDSKINRKLYKISDATGSIRFTDITPTGNRLSKELLDSSDVFLVYGTTGKLYIWVGKGANSKEKKEAFSGAIYFLSQNGLPSTTPIQRVSDGNEPSSFISEFSLWDAPHKFGHGVDKTVVKGEDDPISVANILARKATADVPIDDGKGTLKVWVIKDFKKEEINPRDYGEFYSGDSYILLYTYRRPGKNADDYIIYYWLGNESTPDEKGAAALLSVELDDSLGGKPVQVRVTQGKEPAHFRQLFQGRTIIYSGGNESGFKRIKSDNYHTQQEEVAFFHVKGTNALNTYALQVSTDATNLNSQDTFVLVTSTHVFNWKGSGANEAEAAVAANISAILASKYKGKAGRSIVPVQEGSEPTEFWNALGGKKEYAAFSPGEDAPRDARLFSASTASGKFKLEEVENFDQSDLNDEDVFLLDTYVQLFVWIGTQSTREEKEKAFKAAELYVAEANDGRDPQIPIIRVNAGEEPSIFTCHFLGWDSDYTKKRAFIDPYQLKLEALAQEKAKKTADLSASSVAATSNPVKTYAAPTKGAYTYEQLKSTENLPASVDPSRREEYLDDATFQSLLKTDRAVFAALPKWKRDEAKKKVGLF